MKKIVLFAIVAALAFLIGTRSGGHSLTAGSGSSDAVFTNHASEIASSSYAVSGTGVQVLSRNPGRLYAFCVNNGAPNVFLSLGGGASKSWGFTLAASQSYQFKRNENLYLGPVYAITLGGATRVSCYDVTAQ